MLTFDHTDRKKKLLQVGDSYFISPEFASYFGDHGYELFSVTCESAELPAIIRMHPELIIIDFDMACNDPYLISAILHKALPESHIAILNGHSRHCHVYEAKLSGAVKILSRHYELAECEELLHATEESIHA